MRKINAARRLRRQATDVEVWLWSRLRGSQVEGAKFRRQHPIGPVIADFACPARGLVVELDGEQHAFRTAEDEARSRALAAAGYRVLRFWNTDVRENGEGVLETIRQALMTPTSPGGPSGPPPSPP